jgi:hypothetical protein
MFLGPWPADTLYGLPVLKILEKVSKSSKCGAMEDVLRKPQIDMSTPLVALEEIPVECGLLNHSRVPRVPRRPVLLVG